VQLLYHYPRNSPADHSHGHKLKGLLLALRGLLDALAGQGVRFYIPEPGPRPMCPNLDPDPRAETRTQTLQTPYPNLDLHAETRTHTHRPEPGTRPTCPKPSICLTPPSSAFDPLPELHFLILTNKAEHCVTSYVHPFESGGLFGAAWSVANHRRCVVQIRDWFD
jgi:hypothetical protein